MGMRVGVFTTGAAAAEIATGPVVSTGVVDLSDAGAAADIGLIKSANVLSVYSRYTQRQKIQFFLKKRSYKYHLSAIPAMAPKAAPKNELPPPLFWVDRVAVAIAKRSFSRSASAP